MIVFDEEVFEKVVGEKNLDIIFLKRVIIDYISFHNENGTIVKRGGSFWHTIVGNEVFEDGNYVWNLRIDEYGEGNH